MHTYDVHVFLQIHILNSKRRDAEMQDAIPVEDSSEEVSKIAYFHVCYEYGVYISVYVHM